MKISRLKEIATKLPEQTLDSLAEAHAPVAESYTKIGQPDLSARHNRQSEAYRKPLP